MDVRIESNGTSECTHVYLNGERLQYVTRLDITFEPRGRAEVRVDFIQHERTGQRVVALESSFTTRNATIRIDPEWKPDA